MLSQSPQAGQFNSYIAEKERGVYPDTEMSQSPQAGQFNSYPDNYESERCWRTNESQSPQAGQFNSYDGELVHIEPDDYVSIPSSGSIQFLHTAGDNHQKETIESQSPQAGQFNSYLKAIYLLLEGLLEIVSIPSSGSIQFLLCKFQTPSYIQRGAKKSQSPQAGQFNSYRLCVIICEV